jgi:pilus assembly protein FimV
LDFGDDLTAESEADDLSELSLALDNLDADTLPEDLELKASSIDEEFNFDLDDDLEFGELGQDESHELVAEASESLDVPADDFNLDMNVDDVDLAALDHEMESLDVDFDDDLLADEKLEVGSATGKFDLDDDFTLEDLDSTEAGSLQDQVSASKLSLTDDLDSPEASLDFDLEDGETFSLGDEEALDEDDLDLAALEEDLDELSEMPESARSGFAADDAVVDLELHDEIPSPEEESALVEADDGHDEDLFTEALSDFSGESDDIDLNEFSSDEAALADLSDDDMDAELDFLADADEAATKLDLARAYIDMGDTEGAKDILSEVLGEGNDDQRKEANELLGRIG